MNEKQPRSGGSRNRPVDAILGRTLRKHYVVDSFIGEGAFGRVYLASDTTTDVQIALKLIDLNNEFAKEIRERVNREAAALARIPSDHVVRLVDFFEYEGKLAILMEYAPGKTLEEILEDRDSLSLETAIDVLRQISSGLSAVHDKGLIHRDLKPENVMLEKTRDGTYFVRIIDLGIAHAVTDARITQGFIGTPKYACPEQITEAKLTPRSDIYALGLIAYEMLSGRPAFDGTSILAVLNQQVNHKPARLEWPGVGDKRDWIRLADLVARMLEKRPEDRPSSMDQVTELLAAIVSRQTLAVESSLAEISQVIDESGRDDEPDEHGFGRKKGSAVFQPFDEDSDCYTLSDLSEVSNIAYSESTREVRLFSNEASELIATYETKADLISICIDGQSAILGFRDHIELVDLPNAAESRLIDTQGDLPRAVDLNIRRRTCAVGHESGSVVVLRDIPMINVDVRFEVANSIETLKLDRDARALAIATTRNLWLFAIPSKKFEKRWKAPIDGRVIDIAFSRDGYLVAALFDDGRVEILSTVNASLVTSEPPSDVTAIEFSESGDLITLHLGKPRPRL